MIYLHICEFPNGWAFVPSLSKDAPRRGAFGEKSTPNWSSKNACIDAALAGHLQRTRDLTDRASVHGGIMVQFIDDEYEFVEHQIEDLKGYPA